MSYSNVLKVVRPWRLYSYQRKDYGTGWITLDSSNVQGVHDRVRSGTSVPGFRYLISRGQSASSGYTSNSYEDFFHPAQGYTLIRYSEVHPPLERYREDRLFGFAFSANMTEFTHLSTSSSNADSLALSRILRRVRDDQKHFSSLTFLGELNESVRMILRPASALRDGLARYASSTSKKVSKLSKRSPPSSRFRAASEIIAGSWLEHSFGWQPLLSDIKSAAETVARFDYDKRISRSTGYGEWETSQSFDFVDTGTNRHIRQFVYPRKITKHSVRYVCGLSTESRVASQSLERLSQLSGFTFSDVLPTVWELVPWSFLIDYFANIGDIIEGGCTNTSGVTWISKSSRLVTTYEYGVRPAFIVNAGESLMASNYVPPVSKSIRSTLTRTVPLSLGIPNFRLVNPFESFGKVANMFALLASSQRTIQRAVK